MNRNILNAVLLLTMGAGLAATAQETNSGAATDWSSFESIAQKNIFDPARSGRAGNRRIRRAAVRSFTFHGTIDDTAWFTGEGAPREGYVKVGKLINGFKVMQITLHSVKLADPGGNILVLKEDESMRRTEDGPWAKSDQPEPAGVATSETQAGESTASSSPAPAGVSDIIARLRARHKQEE
jgi:hypothetical protein